MKQKNPYEYNGDALVMDNKSKTSSVKSVYIESYGCAMNFSDSEIVASILYENGYKTTNDMYVADLILVNTCSIREKAELTVRKRLEKFNRVKNKNSKVKVGVLGCMAERLKHKFLEEEKTVDMVVGPDAYKDLPNLLEDVDDGKNAVNVILSKDETYGDISPTRINSNGVKCINISSMINFMLHPLHNKLLWNFKSLDINYPFIIIISVIIYFCVKNNRIFYFKM